MAIGLSRRILLVTALLTLMLPASAFALSIARKVRDTSGGVLPGVPGEATRPALIERSRSAVTDANGQYQIIDLRPGSYTITFTLPGFATVARPGVVVTGGGVTSINAEMRVSGV